MRVYENKYSIKAKIQGAMDDTEDVLKDKLVEIAGALSTLTPVSTGAYAESFSVDTSGGGSIRRVSSEGREWYSADLISSQNTAFTNMTNDINSIEVLNSNKVQFKNGAPHATEVEAEHQVFGTVKDRFR
jgi:hypothetical protein